MVYDPDPGFRKLDPMAVVEVALSTVAGREFPQDIGEDCYASYAGDRFVESIGYVRRYPDELPALAARLGEIQTPVLAFAGLRDRVVTLANAEFLTNACPTAGWRRSAPAISSGEEAPDAFGQPLDERIDEHNPTPGGSR